MKVLEASEVSIVRNGKPIIDKLNFTIHTNEIWAIIGASGSGKTSLLKAISGEIFYRGNIHSADENRIVLVEQQHYFKNLSNTSGFYYQQRYNSQDAEDALTVYQSLCSTGENIDEEQINHLAELFNIRHLYNEPLIQLSNGENKRVQLVKALLLEPTILLLDNPFIGLDVASRQMLEQLLATICNNGVHIIMVTGAHQLPTFITHVLKINDDGTYTIKVVTAADRNKQHLPSTSSIGVDTALLNHLIEQAVEPAFEYAVRMKDVNITYDHPILKGINWEVKRGERWSLTGHNGSGKSTLLSLVTADNPQAYANEIYLFDRKRGTGETIWEIKRQIGFVSPELHLYFDKSNTSFEVIASGFFDTIGLFRQISDDQATLIHKWMQLLHIDHLNNKLLNQLSGSQQRLVLLARALVKNPPLLVLDEPCQGLDEEQTMLFTKLVNDICIHANKTLIYVSHYADEIPQCITRHIELSKGKRIR